MQKAERAIGAAESLLRDGNPDFSVSRAYYAMFYAAEAMLAATGQRFRKHGGVHAAFGEQFVRTGRVDSKLHRWLLDAFDKRLQSDYGIEAEITVEDAETVIEQAREFVRVARTELGAGEGV